MTTEKRQNPRKFSPVAGEIYENAGGGRYFCEKSYGSDAWMINVSSGWSFFAVGIVRYEDGTIEWDCSTDGHFILLTEEKKATIYRAGIRSRQKSLMNAMLCCMI